MNYYLHNVGYDKPIDFRRIVLQIYKAKRMWLRDESIDRLGLYDYTKWLPNVAYEQSNLKYAQKSYNQAKKQLAAITEEKLQELYAEELSKYEVLHNSTNSYYADLAAKAKRCAEEYNIHLDKWLSIPNTPSWITEELVDIYDTAIKDAEENEANNVKAVERMHSEMPPTFDEFAERKLKNLEDTVSFHADRVKSAKRAIQMISKECEEVKQLFDWLDQIEKENKTNESCN